jgi:NDP-sugar pyrophosphorylase family protein
MIEDFFNDIKAPDFVADEFKKDDWYKLIVNARDVLNKNIEGSTIKSKISDSIKIKGNGYIGENCTIGENVVIEGPFYIGDNVEIGHGAYIRSGSIICDNCSVGFVSHVKNSLMMEGSKIANHCFLSDSIIGANSRVGGHSETSNRRFDQGEIEFVYKENKLFTGLDKLGMVLGEGSRLGGGVFTYPGTMIGKNTFISTMACVGGYVGPNKFLKFKSDYEIVENNFKGELKHTYLFEKV